ncbi:MAG: V-type ATP synthase subunit E [Spirochaetes bacterium]|nr:V-type ATP synthase subunit E [Spirochaetota bacterium]
MAVEDIIKKIISDAEEKAGTILKEYKEQADKLIAGQKQELEKKDTSEKKRIDQEAEDHYKRLIQMAELEMRKSILDLKQRLILDVFTKVEEKISSMPKEDYQKFIENKIMDYIQTGSEVVIISKNDKERITGDFIDMINKKLKDKLHQEGSLKLSKETAPIKAGFILKSDKIQFNSSLESMLRELREKSESEIVNKFFKE